MSTMFPTPWDRHRTFPALSSLFGPRSPHRPSSSRPPCLSPYGTEAKCSAASSYDKLFKTTRFSARNTPSSPDCSSDWDDPYTLDTDSNIFPKHRTPTFSSPRRSTNTLDLKRVTLTLPSAAAEDLRTSDILILPRLVYLHVRLSTPYAGPEKLRATVPETMAFGDVIKQVTRSYVGDAIRGCDVTARVEQRGRMVEPAPLATMEDLAHRGEVLRDGRREMRVEVVVRMGDEGERVSVRGRYVRRGPWGGDADVEMVSEREVSRTRVAHA